MDSLLSSGQAVVSAALRDESFQRRLADRPDAAIAELDVAVADKRQAIKHAEQYLHSVAVERRYLDQLLVTTCDSDFEATTDRETNASDRDC